MEKTKKSRKTENNSENTSKTSENGNKKPLAIVRITGEVKLKSDIIESLNRLRLRKKYVCTLIDPDNKSLMGILNKVKYFVAFGEIEKDTLVKLISKRGQIILEPNKKSTEKINAEKIAEDLFNGKTIGDLSIKPFFRLHPPRGGIKSKLQYPKGVLGNNKKDINKLIERML